MARHAVAPGAHTCAARHVLGARRAGTAAAGLGTYTGCIIRWLWQVRGQLWFPRALCSHGAPPSAQVHYLKHRYRPELSPSLSLGQRMPFGKHLPLAPADGVGATQR